MHKFADRLQGIVDELRIVEMDTAIPPPTVNTTPWLIVLNGDNVDWLHMVRQIQAEDLKTWQDLCTAMSSALYGLDLGDSTSLQSVVYGLAGWINELSWSKDPHSEVDWAGWIDALEAYLVKEDAEPDEYDGVTFEEFCEALASTIQNVLCRGGLHTWVSPYQKTPRRPVNMQRVMWYVALVLWRIPEWLGEGLVAGEMTPKESDPWSGGDTPWSQP